MEGPRVAVASQAVGTRAGEGGEAAIASVSAPRLAGAATGAGEPGRVMPRSDATARALSASQTNSRAWAGHFCARDRTQQVRQTPGIRSRCVYFWAQVSATR